MKNTISINDFRSILDKAETSNKHLLLLNPYEAGGGVVNYDEERGWLYSRDMAVDISTITNAEANNAHFRFFIPEVDVNTEEHTGREYHLYIMTIADPMSV